MFWVHAGSAPRLEKGYLDIAKEVNIVGWDSSDPNIDKLLLVKNWFEGKTSGQWILILDNADDTSLFYGHDASSRLAEYFPRSSNGSILLTTRNKQVGLKFTTARNVIPVSALTTAESVRLLKAKVDDDTGGERSYADLANTLDNVPLALVQAAAYILEQSCPVSEYLDLYNRSDVIRIQLLSKDFEDDIRDSTTKNPVSATFAISFEHIKNSHPMAADILSFISTLDAQAIPTSLIPFDEDPVLFTEALGTLKAFSLITITSQDEQQNKLFGLHRLVRLAMRNWLSLSYELELWTTKAVLITSKRFPTPKHENRETCRAYLPHALVLISADQITEEQIALALLQANVSWYLYTRGDYTSAELIARRSLALSEKALGQEHQSTLGTMGILAVVLGSQGRYEDAEAINQRTVKLNEEVLGQEHPHTLGSMSNLASVLHSQGRYEEAEAMDRRTLELRNKTLGQEHPETLTSMSNLAMMLYNQGKYEEAEALSRRTLELRLEALGQKHPDTLASMSNLALVLDNQGKYEEAEALSRRTLELRLEALGQKHPETLESMSNLAMMLDNQGKYEEAEALSRNTLELKEEVLGPDHPNTLRSVFNLACYFGHQRGYRESCLLFQRACTGFQIALGESHPMTLKCLEDYESLLEAMEQTGNEQPRPLVHLQRGVPSIVISPFSKFKKFWKAPK